MKVTITYMAQLKQAAGVASEQVELSGPCSVADLVQDLAGRHGAGFRRLLLDRAGALQPTNLFFIGDAQVQRPEQEQLKDGDLVTVLSPIAGGSNPSAPSARG